MNWWTTAAWHSLTSFTYCCWCGRWLRLAYAATATTPIHGLLTRYNISSYAKNICTIFMNCFIFVVLNKQNIKIKKNLFISIRLLLPIEKMINSVFFNIYGLWSHYYYYYWFNLFLCLLFLPIDRFAKFNIFFYRLIYL